MHHPPFTYAREKGRSFSFLGTLMTLKAGGSQTNGQFSLIEQLLPPGFATPLHMHHSEDEAFYILEGAFLFFVGNEVLHVEPGAFVFLPRDVPHAFRVEGDAPARLLQLTAPAGLEQGFIEMGEPTTQLNLPPPYTPTPDEVGQMAAVSAKYHVEQLGPPPEQLWSVNSR
ncbi:MAG: cupin domain-containing protein [Roseiflexaceae bacterium]|nr:cupin domain-containing protein [Roseiflexaceae bacterium]